jgi:5-methyltetrahydropteroyltriglutamate--homocysteine methyltransferase
METVHRAETVGSLLRPTYLAQAQESFAAGKIDAAEFKRIEDRAVDQAIALQEGAGLDVVADGELRRHSFLEHWFGALNGVSEAPGVQHTFHGATPEDTVTFGSPISVTEKISRRGPMLTLEEFAYARARARKPVKITVPSPLLLFNLWSPEHSKDAYPSPYDLFAEGVDLLREEVRALAAIGCTYIQVDAPDLGTLADPEHGQAKTMIEQLGMPLERTLTEGVDMVNAVADVPGVTFALHLCKGNFESRWLAAGGYDSIAEAVFQRADNYDVFMLEYDDERSGDFAPLAKVPDDKVVSLGLISSKVADMETPESVVARIEEAAKHFPLEQLSVSTQCGFASVASGNAISEAVQEAKLRLVGDVADRVWG